MIASLRRRHLRYFALLLVVVPIAFWAGLTYRKSPPVMNQLPAPLRPDITLDEIQTLSAQIGEWDPPLLRSRLYQSPRGGLLVELIPESDLKQPDLLLYWSPQPSSDGKALPASIRLLGSHAGRQPQAFALPAEAEGAPGWLILYSLAHHEIFSSHELPEDLSKGED